VIAEDPEVVVTPKAVVVTAKSMANTPSALAWSATDRVTWICG
jgi:hypothetical protein